MAKKTTRYVVVHSHGWAIRDEGADRVSEVCTTQAEARQKAKAIVSRLGGGEVKIQDRNRHLRETIVVSPEKQFSPPFG